MVSQPLASAGATNFLFHVELFHADGQYEAAAPAALELIEKVHAAGMNAGMAVKPATPAKAVVPYVKAGLD